MNVSYKLCCVIIYKRHQGINISLFNLIALLILIILIKLTRL